MPPLTEAEHRALIAVCQDQEALADTLASMGLFSEAGKALAARQAIRALATRVMAAATAAIAATATPEQPSPLEAGSPEPMVGAGPNA